MRILTLALAAAALALTACGADEEKPTASPASPSASSAPASSLDEVAAHVAKAIGGTVEPGPEVWVTTLGEDETYVCGGTVVGMAAGNPYPDEIVITDPAGRFGVYVPSPDDARCLTELGEALATVGE